MRTDSKTLELLAQRASGKEGFLGAALQAVAEASGASLSDMGSRIDCPAENLPRLSLCKIPRESVEHFASDVRKISEFVECSAAELANLIREYHAIAAMRKYDPEVSSHDTMLMAARDKKSDHDGDEGPDE